MSSQSQLQWQSLSYILERRLDSEDCCGVSSHRIIVQQKKWGLMRCTWMGILLALCLKSVMKNEMELWHQLILFGTLALYLASWRKGVQEEAVVVMPTLGVQFEVFYRSKKVSYRFVPLEKIIAPIINEAVTPVTCYFYLALLVRGEDSLTLAFQSLRPPLEVLVPIWRSVCDAVDISRANPESRVGDISTEDESRVQN